MLCRSSFLAVAPVFLLAAAVLAGEPIFDSRPGQPWDQTRDIFYVRRFATGEVFEHPHAFAPPWNEFIPFTHDAAFYEQVLSCLEAVENLPPAQMEEQPASRRLIFLRDLWPVFDGLHRARVEMPRDKKATAERTIRSTPPASNRSSSNPESCRQCQRHRRPRASPLSRASTGPSGKYRDPWIRASSATAS